VLVSIRECLLNDPECHLIDRRRQRPNGAFVDTGHAELIAFHPGYQFRQPRQPEWRRRVGIAAGAQNLQEGTDFAEYLPRRLSNGAE
jgi:hypothetical protein